MQQLLPSRFRLLLFTFAFVATAQLGTLHAQKWSQDQLDFFERRIRPIFVKRCNKCHSAEATKIQGGLRLDSRELLLKGGDSGPAIVVNQPDKSLLISAVNYLSNEMPPDRKLRAASIADLTKWVSMGAPWPKTEKALAPKQKGYDFASWRSKHWAFQPVIRPAVPRVKTVSWPKTAIDRFVLAGLEKADMRPARPAAKRTLLRRLYLDLTGTPPPPAQMRSFLADRRPDAYERVVDRLLASPLYGERWGRHWLDVARYSDGFGGFLDNAALPHAYRYRDWVVGAFNSDLPYDEFVRLQVSGDLKADFRDSVATGLFAIGPSYRSDGGDPESVAQAKSETLDDRVDTLTRAFLALTVSCARCHDHKFDPIPTEDYYSLAGVFNNTGNAVKPFAPSETVAAFDKQLARINQLQKQIKQRQAQQKKAPLNEDQQKELQAWIRQVAALRADLPPKYPVIHALAERGAADMPIALRGDLRKKGPIAPRRFLRILSGDKRVHFTQGSGRRELAAAIADKRNPLTARVIVNRIWLHHFGRALVRSPSNFGSLGQRPTHPELLDWLADEFVRRQWSIKSLHRLILKSAAYRMSSQYDARNFQADSDNRKIWRMEPRRLEVEAWRDALLAVTGELSTQIGGPPSDNILGSRRRTLYTKISRTGDRFSSDAFLRLFDFPTPRATSPKRVTSTVPQQYLFMMNSPFMVARARALVERLRVDVGDTASQVDRAYLLLFGRRPTARETAIALSFLDTQAQRTADVKLTPWQQYAQVLLSANEFIHVQ